MIRFFRNRVNSSGQETRCLSRTWTFIFTFTTAHHLILSWMRRYSWHRTPYACNIILILSNLLCCLFPLYFTYQNVSLSSHNRLKWSSRRPKCAVHSSNTHNHPTQLIFLKLYQTNIITWEIILNAIQIGSLKLSIWVQCWHGKGKAVPLQAQRGLEGSRKLRFPDFVTTAQDGGRLYPPGNTPGTRFS